MKQAIILRTDIKMGKGKAAAQAAHASLEAYKNSPSENKKEWDNSGSKKVVLKIEDEKALMELFLAAKLKKLPTGLIKDAGRTQLEPGTTTALAIGPAEENRIDDITKHLKLY